MESSRGFDVPPVLTPDVEKRLLNVFTNLRQHERKARLARRMAELSGVRSAMEPSEGMNEQTQKKSADDAQPNGRDHDPRLEPSRESVAAALQEEIDELQRSISHKILDPTGCITAADLNSALRMLHRVTSKSDIQWMIWEVDDNLDGCIDWDEFRGSYARCIADRRGAEPIQLYHLIQFMFCDFDNSLTMSVDAMKRELSRLPGTDHLISALISAFKIQNEQQELEKHSFSEYLDAMLPDLPHVGFLGMNTISSTVPHAPKCDFKP